MITGSANISKTGKSRIVQFYLKLVKNFIDPTILKEVVLVKLETSAKEKFHIQLSKSEATILGEQLLMAASAIRDNIEG